MRKHTKIGKLKSPAKLKSKGDLLLHKSKNNAAWHEAKKKKAEKKVCEREQKNMQKRLRETYTKFLLKVDPRYKWMRVLEEQISHTA